MNKPKLIIMIGLPGSGKSTLAQKIYKENPSNYKIICLDDIRKELFGSEMENKDGFRVASIGRARILGALNAGYNVIYDATTVTKQYRKWCLNTNAEHIGIYMNVPIEECLRRNQSRARKVPEDVIYKMNHKLQSPELIEGFDKIFEITLDKDNPLCYNVYCKENNTNIEKEQDLK